MSREELAQASRTWMNLIAGATGLRDPIFFYIRSGNDDSFPEDRGVFRQYTSVMLRIRASQPTIHMPADRAVHNLERAAAMLENLRRRCRDLGIIP